MTLPELDLSDPLVAAALVRAVDRRVDSRLEQLLPRHVYGTIASVDEATHTVSAYLFGSATASPAIRYPEWLLPVVGQRVRVVLLPSSGDRYVDELYGEGGIRLGYYADASLSSVGHPLQIGPTSGENLIVDSNELLARINGGMARMGVNLGGSLHMGGSVFPTTGLVNGELFFRIDLLGWYVYATGAGNRWLGVYAETITTGIHTAAAIPATANFNEYAPLPGTDIWLEDVVLVTHCASTDASNYWTITASKADAAINNVTLGSAVNTSADTASSWTRHNISVGALVTATYESFRLACVKTGAPGAIYVNGAFRYRRIAT